MNKTKTNPHPFQSRISFKGDLKILLDKVIKLYGFSDYKDHEVIGVGYEDFNIKLVTSKGKYLLKFFADFREENDCLRYVDIMTSVNDAGIKHPKLHKSYQGYYSKLKTEDGEVRLVITDFIDGKTFYQLKEKPNQSEQDFLVNQVAKINQLQIKPKYVYDSWAVVNFAKEYEKVKSDLKQEDIELIDPLYEEFSKLDVKSLPHCFVHGDVIDTNVIRSESGELYILDFSVSNVYPRIQELAVMLCDILFDSSKDNQFDEVYKRALEIYQKVTKLTEEELKLLPLFVKVAHAMHIIGATKANVEEGLSEENDHWISVGREGLKFAVKFWS